MNNIIDPGTYSSGSIIADLKARADIVDQVSDTVTYLGICSKGTNDSTADEAAQIWSILKIEASGAGPVITRFQWANGTASYNLVWNSRATYNYQYKKF